MSVGELRAACDRARDALLDQDVQVLWHNNDTTCGRDTVTSSLKELFEWTHTSAFDPIHQTSLVDSGPYPPHTTQIALARAYAQLNGEI